MPVRLDGIPRISVDDVDMAAIDMTDYLDSGELLTGTPVVVEVTTSDLTISNESVSTASEVIKNVEVAIGKAIKFKVIDQVAGTTYELKVTASTDSTPARTVNMTAFFAAVA